MADLSQPTGDANSGVRTADVVVESVKIRNFRGIADCTLALEPRLTLLVGRNNSGKSRLLRGLAIALGAETPEHDDISVGVDESPEIEVVLAPGRATDDGSEVFDVRVTRRFGDVQAVSENPVRERFAWRTVLTPSRDGSGVRSSSTVLVFDSTNETWSAPESATYLSAEQRSLVVADLIGTRRDLNDELGRRGSAIRRVLDDLEIAPEARGGLEAELQALGSSIVSHSGSLDAVTKSLQALTSAVDSVGAPSIQPLPVRLEELARGVSIALNTGRGDLPLRLHGSGSRSLASLQVQSVMYQRRTGADGPNLRPHTISLIEEPESHLHPQAHRELADLLLAIQGQAVVSTHSAHLASTVDHHAIRLVRSDEAVVTCLHFRPDGGYIRSNGSIESDTEFAMEVEKIQRFIERPFGELLFATSVVIGDGATERAFLPPILRRLLGARASGVCVVDPGSLESPNLYAVLKFANRFDMPWVLFADADRSGTKAADKLIREQGNGDSSRVVWSGTRGTAESSIEPVLFNFDEDLCRAACDAVGAKASDDVLNFMRSRKGVIGRALALELLERYPAIDRARTEAGYWPTPLRNLAAALDSHGF